MLLLHEGRKESWATQEAQIKAEGRSKSLMLIELEPKHYETLKESVSPIKEEGEPLSSVSVGRPRRCVGMRPWLWSLTWPPSQFGYGGPSTLTGWPLEPHSAPVTYLEPHLLCALSCSGRGEMRLSSIWPVELLKSRPRTSVGEGKWLGSSWGCRRCQELALPFPEPSHKQVPAVLLLPEKRARRLKHHKQQALSYLVNVSVEELCGWFTNP